MMRCLIGCFRVTGADDGGAGREVKGGGGGDGQVVAPSLAQMTSHEVGGGKRARPPSRNALSAVFLREDEGSRLELTPSSWTDQREDMKKEQDLKHETIMHESCASSLDTTNEPQRVLEDMDSVHQTECGPSMFDNVHLMESLNVEDCETPSRYHQSSTVPDAMRQHKTAVGNDNKYETEGVVGSNCNSLTFCTFVLNHYSSSKANEEMQTPATSNATDWEGLTKESNTEASIQYHVLDPAQDYEKCTVSRPSEDFNPLDKPSGDPNCNENDNFAPIEITVSEECSLFQSSEDSVSSFDKINDTMNTTSVEKSLATEVTTHSTRKKVLKNSDSEKEFPSLSQWLKPPNPKKPFRDEALTGDRSAKSSDEDRPIIGMVAAHWKDEEPEKFTPKWWDGNGIPNSTNKYKEDQKVSWHAMSFEERLEKALSEEKLLSERNCFSGKSSHFLGMEGEESDTAESNHLYAAAHA